MAAVIPTILVTPGENDPPVIPSARSRGQKPNLANTLLTMNLLAFLFHTVLELYDLRYQVIRNALGRRQAFFDDFRALTRYMCFDSWDELLLFMLNGLKIPDPVD